jgi:hypothetical protein
MARIGNTSPTAPAAARTPELTGQHLVVLQDRQQRAKRRGGQREPYRDRQ